MWVGTTMQERTGPQRLNHQGRHKGGAPNSARTTPLACQPSVGHRQMARIAAAVSRNPIHLLRSPKDPDQPVTIAARMANARLVFMTSPVAELVDDLPDAQAR